MYSYSRAEPLADSRNYAGQQSLHVFDVVKLRRPPVLLVDHNDLPVRLVCNRKRRRLWSSAGRQNGYSTAGKKEGHTQVRNDKARKRLKIFASRKKHHNSPQDKTRESRGGRFGGRGTEHHHRQQEQKHDRTPQNQRYHYIQQPARLLSCAPSNSPSSIMASTPSTLTCRTSPVATMRRPISQTSRGSLSPW